MTGYESHLQEMADPVYVAAVRAVVAEAPPLTDEQRQTLRAIFHGSVPFAEHRETGDA